VAAGDQLRQHYQALSADPGSLANLDQDLPNNMQGILPIVSFLSMRSFPLPLLFKKKEKKLKGWCAISF
jgi:hypothetical protein